MQGTFRPPSERAPGPLLPHPLIPFPPHTRLLFTITAMHKGAIFCLSPVCGTALGQEARIVV